MEPGFGAVANLVAPILGKLETQWNLAAGAEKDYVDLVDLRREIQGFFKNAMSGGFSDKLKACTKKMEDIFSESEQAIDGFKRPSSKLNRRTFASKVEDLRQMMARYVNNLEKTHALENFNQLPGDHAQYSSAAYCSSPIPYHEETDVDLVGFEGPRGQLVPWLTEDNLMPKVIFVHGPPGVGKTSLVGSVLRCREVKEHFKYYVWIKDLTSCKLAEDMKTEPMKANAKMWNLYKNDDQGDEVELEEVFQLISEDKDLKDNKRRWALVLDDAREADVFKSLKIHLFKPQPSVLVTTCISNLASSSKLYLDSHGAQSGGASPEPSTPRYGFPNFKLPVLSMDDSRKLFFRKMFSQDSCPPDFEVDYDNILLKCGGLPLAILAMCEHLIHSERGGGDPQYDEWKKWSGSLGNLLFSPLSNYGQYGPIRRMVAQCVERLHDVRSWVLYLSIFPLDCPIRCSTLMRLWMAEKFPMEVRTNWNPSIPEQALKKLVDCNFFQEVKEASYERIGTCRVNNLLHQIIVSQSKNDEFATIVDGEEKLWPDKINRLSFHITMEREVECMKVRRLSYLHVNKKVYPKSMKKLLGQLESLQVLDLQRLLTRVEKNSYQNSLKSFPREILRLKCLRYLSLRDNIVKEIPDGIGDLACLETLDLKGTNVSKLPDRILKLTRLRHLLVYRPNRHLVISNDQKYGFKAPTRLGELKSLEKLCMIELDPVKKGRRGRKNNRRRWLLEEIGKLTKLQRLGISMLRSTDVELLFPSIGKLTNLEALRLIAAPGQKINLSKQDEKKVLKTLKRVHLTGCLETVRNWILPLTSVVKLVLKGSQLNGDAPEHLGKLHSLKHLELQQAFVETVLTFEARGFQKLLFLGLDTIDNLQSIIVEDKALPTLEILSLARCKSLKTVPPYITRSCKFKCLKLYGMPKEFMTAVKGIENLPARIKVQCKLWKEGAAEDALQPLTKGARRSS